MMIEKNKDIQDWNREDDPHDSWDEMWDEMGLWISNSVANTIPSTPNINTIPPSPSPPSKFKWRKLFTFW
jgi:hypothetical protein